MAHAYTPGLKVTERVLLRKERKLPLPGEVLVRKGDIVEAETVVAKTELPGNVQTVNVANSLSVLPQEVREYMLKREGEKVQKDEVIASTKGLFGLFKSQCRAPADGSIESISEVTGQVLIRERPIPVQIDAYIDGEVIEVAEGEGVTVETQATFIQGIFGIGGEAVGELLTVCENPEDVLTPDSLEDGLSGRIIVGGSLVTGSAVKRAIELGAKGIIAGGIDGGDLRDFLGYELGVAITGSEDLGITLVVTEGFGRMKMAERTFGLLKEREGMKTSINGATQIRAGVIRPEVVIPLEGVSSGAETPREGESELVVGSPVRVIREPYFGRLGTVTDLPVQLQKLETEAVVRVLEVEFEDGTRAVLPRANVEMIEA